MVKKSNSKSTKKKKQNKSNIKKKRNDFDLEAYAIGLIAISFLLFLSIYFKNNFILTSFIRNVFIGLFGICAYIIPIVILYIGSYFFLKQKTLPVKKYVILALLLIVISAFFQTVSNTDFYNATNDTNFITKAYTSATFVNGGLFGAIVSSLLKMIVGPVITGILLVVAFLELMILFFDKSFMEIFTKVKNKISDFFAGEDLEEIDEIDEIDDFNNNTANLNVEREISFSSKEVKKTSAKPDIQKKEGVKSKMNENDDYMIKNNELKNKDIKYSNKPNILNMRKKNPFSKKPKVRIFDFNSVYSDNSMNNEIEPLKNMSRQNMDRPSSRENDGVFVNIKKRNYSEYDDNVTFNGYENSNVRENPEDFFEIEEDFVPKINVDSDYEKLRLELQDKDNTIKSLKDELDRQMFLFQDAQIEFLEQKKMEKSLLKIINAQRETIEKLSFEVKAYENVANSIKKESVINATPVEVKPEPVAEVHIPVAEPVIEEILPIVEDIIIEEPVVQQAVIVESYIDDDIINDDFTEEDTLNLSIAQITNEAIDIIEVNEEDYDDDDETIEIIDEIKDSKTSLEELDKMYSELYKNDDEAIVKDEPKKAPESIFTPVVIPKPAEKPVEVPKKYEYKYPTVDFLNPRPEVPKEQHSKTELLANSKKLELTLKSFGVVAKVMEVSKGPSVTRYEVQPGLGVKVSKIANLADDLALNLAAKSIRIQAPIPGKAAVGIEVPNDTTEMVYLRDVLDDQNFKDFKSKLAFGIGKDIAGKIVVADLATMPHLLIAGATGSGKSVCVNTLITSIVYKSSPDEVKLLMIDPKVVELSVYNGIPHLLIPVVTDPKKASAALNWAVREMEKRYKLFSDKNVRDLKGYNQIMKEEGGLLEPQIVIIIDELADLMMTAAKEVEAAIIRLAQMARAAGIHLIIATQRPSVDVITGIIKANIPSRLAFAVSSGVDSKTILDTTGAEKLLGKGDMLFSPMGSPEPIRIQGAFISDKEVESIVSFLKTDTDHEHMKEIIEEITSSGNSHSVSQANNDTVDEILEDVVEFIITSQKASTSLIQRRFRVGFNRAARIIDELESFGVIGPDEGNKPRRVLMTLEEWDNKFKT